MRTARVLIVLLVLVVVVALARPAEAQRATEQPFEPVIGQPGKDVIWVPTPEALVEKMMDLAEVTRRDFVIDLGSGDGRNVIAAAKRGARALGVEFNPQMVELSKRRAEAAGVGRRARFVQGDMYQADISKASVLALFLLPSNMLQLRDKFLALAPGSRIVSNTFYIQDWSPDRTEEISPCSEWCTALLWIVPARVAGDWRTGSSTLALTQTYQMLTGTLDGRPISQGRMRGDEISFTVDGAAYNGRVKGTSISGTVTSGGVARRWKARRAK